ncbi:ABC transporter ATP-binding protein/permease [Alsobacter sp. SYSU M60028]|uniref:ABC transporter ATP-binding protein/permease n=1 Tax=Alsobacter ponti TaxID=2962936 RepID=A0ABT1LCF4_9HYPH|nr:ABC transporter ATP-binding protein/permease [Alsobacter ponti]MCP8939172.1 ABC transporter ATP-binding protein/permease [Alsobacter ponti]
MFRRKLAILAVAVLAFAVLALGVGAKAMDATLIGLGVVGVLFAAAIWSSLRISSFLQVFTGIFGVEYVLFGGVVLLGQLGLWPEALADFMVSRSLPATVAVFGILVWAASHLRVIRSITDIADLYFNDREVKPAQIWPFGVVRMRENRLATIALVSLVLINQVQVGINVRLSFFNRDWFNAIQEKNAADFWSLLYTVFLFWAVIYIVIAILEYVVQSGLTIRWRQDLTNRYTTHWLDDGTHYRMALTGEQADNPDQRIAVDVDRFIELTYGFSITLLATVTTLVSFAIVLWNISASFTIPGTEIVIPGLLFWTALVYASVGTLITHFIGRALAPLNFQQQRFEADFRFSLARLREYAEQVALLEGERAERQIVMGRFGNVIDNFWRIVNLRKRLLAFTAFYGQISPIIPYVIAAPFYFLGKVQLGVLTQTAGAFGRVEGSLTFFINYYVSLADYKAVIDRLTTFGASIRAARALGREPPRLDIAQESGPDVRLDDVELRLPGGRAIVSVPQLTLRAGESALITGASGSGKSTMMRALAGIWPYGEGRISVPAGASVMLLPQRPYIPMGTLRLAVSYPALSGVYTDAQLRDALVAARLPELADSLDSQENWSGRLSGGEQQRLAIARALLARPDWLFLDEATSALDEFSEAALYKMLAEKLPETTVVSIGHRTTLQAMHRRHLQMQPGADGRFTPGDAEQRATA